MFRSSYLQPKPKGIKPGYIIAIIIAMGIAVPVHAQKGPINIVRYLDDFSYLLQSDTLQRTALEKLKYVPLSKDARVNISLGGEIREQYQYFENENFGDFPPGKKADGNGHLWHRVMLHADMRIGDQWRVFTQLNSTFAFDKENLAPEIDENRLSLHQAFIDWRPKNGNGFFARMGRQEFAMGSNLALTMREGPNTRLTFDALVLGLERPNNKLQALLATPVISRTGVFDDGGTDEFIYGIYSVNKLRITTLDAYYFGFYSEIRAYNYQSGIDRRHTLGIRFWDQADNGWNYSIESMYQFGNFNGETISAYNFSSEAFYKIPVANTTLSPGLGLNYITGDRSPTDSKLNTYNVLYSKPSFGLGAPIGPSNIISVRPFFEFNPKPNIRIILSDYFLWRQSENDGSYTPGGIQLRPIPNGLFGTDEKQIGQQLTLDVWYLYNRNWSFFFEGAYFVPGDFIARTGEGKNILYLSAKLSFKF